MESRIAIAAGTIQRAGEMREADIFSSWLLLKTVAARYATRNLTSSRARSTLRAKPKPRIETPERSGDPEWILYLLWRPYEEGK
jgi:hypothetical protein